MSDMNSHSDFNSLLSSSLSSSSNTILNSPISGSIISSNPSIFQTSKNLDSSKREDFLIQKIDLKSNETSYETPIKNIKNKMETFEDLLNYNLEFLSGKRKKVIYHQDPVDLETRPYLNQLIKLHKLKILTTCSQPGYEIDEGDFSQKPYIEFYCHPSQMSMIKKLETNKGYIFYVSDINGNKIYSSKSIKFPYIISKLNNKGNCYLPSLVNKKLRREYFIDNFEDWSLNCLNEYYMVQMVYPKYEDTPIFDDLLLAANNFFNFNLIKEELKNNVNIIGLCGLMGVGKDYITDNYLIPFYKEKVFKIGIADMLKIRSSVEDFSDPISSLGDKNFETRKILQEFGKKERENVYEDYWLNSCIMNMYIQYKNNNIKTFIISDCRFPNEIEILKNIGTKIIKIVAPQRNENKISCEENNKLLPEKNYIISKHSPYKRQKCDISESLIDNINPDYVIYNDPQNVINIEELETFLKTSL